MEALDRGGAASAPECSAPPDEDPSGFLAPGGVAPWAEGGCAAPLVPLPAGVSAAAKASRLRAVCRGRAGGPTAGPRCAAPPVPLQVALATWFRHFKSVTDPHQCQAEEGM